MMISVVVPAHNEEKNIAPLVSGLLAYPEVREVIIVDDNSSDASGTAAERLAREDRRVRVIHRAPPGGVGLALRDGLRAVSPDAEWVLTMDADFVSNVKDVRRLMDAAGGRDGALGSRFCPGGRVEEYPLLKLAANRMFHLCIRWFLGIRQRDVTNNFKLLRKAVTDGIALRSAGFGVNAELGIHAVRGGRSVAEVPVVWKGRGKDMGVSHFSVVREGFSYLTVFIRAVFAGKRGGA